MAAILLTVSVHCWPQWHAVAANRSTLIPYDSNWNGGPDSTWMAFDEAHHQIFTAWPYLDRVDVLSMTSFHLIRSIAVPSPSTLDISPDGSTLAVGTSGSHVLFFNTGTFEKTNDIVFPGANLGITAFVYGANGNAIIRASEGLSTGGGVTAYWNQAENSFSNVSNQEGAPSAKAYITNGGLSRSGDYSKILLADATSSGRLQSVDGTTGQIVWSGAAGEFSGIFLANRDASRYAVCAAPDGSDSNLKILDSSFKVIYQDQGGCAGIIFGADGKTLFREVTHDSAPYTQVLNTTTFAARYEPNYFTQNQLSGSDDALWQASDSSGMIYGIAPINENTGINWIALDTTSQSAPELPPPDEKIHILRVIDNVGSPQGGDFFRLLVSGVDASDMNGVSVSVGGKAATDLSVFKGIFSGPYLQNVTVLTAKTPPGTSGFADVTLSANGLSVTAAKGFQYAQARKIFPFAIGPTYLLYDPIRNRLYASHKDQVEVIDVAGQKLLAPLLPSSGKRTDSQFAGLSLSPDWNRLYIADMGAGRVDELDLAEPGKGYSIDLAKALGQSTPLQAARVFELSNGMLLGAILEGDAGGPGGVFLIDPKSASGELVSGPIGGGYAWDSANSGANVLFTTGIGNSDYGEVAWWHTDSSNPVIPPGITQPLFEAAANADGTVIAVGGSTLGMGDQYPQLVDANLNSLGYIYQHFDVNTPFGTPGFILDPSGAFLYLAGSINVEIDDMHQFQPAASVVFPEPFDGSYAPFTEQMLTTDPAGRYLFGITQSGITMMELHSVPLSIGNVQPWFIAPKAGQSITLRGMGFEPGTTVEIAGRKSTATYVDANTLKVESPALPAGWLDVGVKLPDGTSYTAPGLLQVIGQQPLPRIASCSPGSVPVQLFDAESQQVALIGSGFATYDSIEVNGQLVGSAFIDSNRMQVTIPSNLLLQSTPVAIAVVSPYTGTSNEFALPVVNPAPKLIDNPAIVVGVGTQGVFTVFGEGFVSNSVVLWNGQAISTSPGGLTPSGLGSLSAVAPASLTAKAGTATVQVENPKPGGGISNGIEVKIEASPVLVTADPTSRTVSPGQTATYELSVSLMAGSSKGGELAVGFSCPGVPAEGVGCYFSPEVVSVGSSPVKLQLISVTGNSTPPGTYTLNIVPSVINPGIIPPNPLTLTLIVK